MSHAIFSSGIAGQAALRCGNILREDHVSQSESTASGIDSAASRKNSDAVIAYTILRVSFGANIMLHGLSRLLNGRPTFLAYLTHYFEHTPLIPASMLPTFGAVLPWVETTLGLLLLLGLFTRFGLIAGALVLTLLVIGSNLAQDWTVAGLQLIYCFIYCYLLVHLDRNRISLDAMLGLGAR
jgi:thiosulfate dehydrogenase [quinone] large subunit